MSHPTRGKCTEKYEAACFYLLSSIFYLRPFCRHPIGQSRCRAEMDPIRTIVQKHHGVRKSLATGFAPGRLHFSQRKNEPGVWILGRRQSLEGALYAGRNWPLV